MSADPRLHVEQVTKSALREAHSMVRGISPILSLGDSTTKREKVHKRSSRRHAMRRLLDHGAVAGPNVRTLRPPRSDPSRTCPLMMPPM